jgi:hypothetical protein
MTVRILPFAVQTDFSRTMEPAEAPLLLGMFVDDDDNHVVRNCAAFVSARSLNAHDLPRLDALPLRRHHQILRIEEFSKVSFCDILSRRTIFSFT